MLPPEQNSYTIVPDAIITGYMVLAVDSAGKIRDRPKVGDEVLLMCGAPCRTSSGSWDPQYQWRDSSGAVLANTREHIVTVGSAGTVSYTCEILNSECNGKASTSIISVYAEGNYTTLYSDFFPSNAFLRRRRKKALLRVNDRGGVWRMCILAYVVCACLCTCLRTSAINIRRYGNTLQTITIYDFI